MELLNSKAGEYVPDKLILNAKHPIDVKSIAIANGRGVIARGTVLSLVKETGAYVVCGNTVEGKTVVANCIVAEDVDTGSTATGTSPCCIYISGSFNQNSLIVKTDYTMTATDIENLRSAGIFVGSAN